MEEINQNVALCLEKINDFGGRTIVNVCNGEEFFVPWVHFFLRTPFKND